MTRDCAAECYTGRAARRTAHARVFGASMASDAPKTPKTVRKRCAACGRSCVGYPRYKKRDGDAYYHRRCPSEDLEDTAGTSGDERGRRGRASEEAETSDGYVTTPSVPPSSARRRRVMRRAGEGGGVGGGGGGRGETGETSTSGGGDAAAVAGARELSKIAWWIDDVACGVKSVDVTSTWVRGALVASSGVYVAAAWLLRAPEFSARGSRHRRVRVTDDHGEWHIGRRVRGDGIDLARRRGGGAATSARDEANRLRVARAPRRSPSSPLAIARDRSSETWTSPRRHRA